MSNENLEPNLEKLSAELRLGGTSTHKLEALKEACSRIGIKAEIQGSPAESEINAQPYGFDETYRGALNRAQNTRKESPETMSIGIENGIVPIAGKFIDLAVIVVIMPNGQEFVGTSTGVEFPKEAVETARSRGFDTTTAGSIIAETMGGSGTDPHSILTHGKVSRREILIDAIVAVLSRALSIE